MDEEEKTFPTSNPNISVLKHKMYQSKEHI